ncbi:hypothetical protein [Paenibacillus thalictri]|uniref:hypothetical protein n=1 Tax=Paenibacillus thalictri TaxID=2527873 RepID=UPI00103345A8|nr:hypothetical protein [Paenibacillus thalictri]
MVIKIGSKLPILAVPTHRGKRKGPLRGKRQMKTSHSAAVAWGVACLSSSAAALGSEHRHAAPGRALKIHARWK